MATTTRQLADFILEEGMSDADLGIQGKPHIRPGVLQPAVDGKLLNGATHSGAYGTPQTQTGGDGHSYYWTSIKGSKPIKDPRIGAYFGSQRYRCTSLQTLTDESAAHGKATFSVDGREWMRIQGDGGFPKIENGSTGVYVYCGSGGTNKNVEIEITGYFNKANILGYTNSYAGRKWDSCWVNGTQVNTATSMITTASTHMGATTYRPAGSVIPVQMGTVTAPQITTIKLVHDPDGESSLFGIELIAHDTTDIASKYKIQIPSQNVISYGKKFSIGGSSAATHYDPFNGMTNLSTLHSAKVDTATSLGLDTGTTYGASWTKSSTEHIRPFNGGRVIKWIDSSGTIKTSVTMMPRNAQNLGNNPKNTSSATGIASNEIAQATLNGASTTNAHTINFSDDPIDFGLSEIAKTFHIKEFGNGAANQGQNTSGTFQDCSMLSNTNDNIGYVMFDGLTSISGRTAESAANNAINYYRVEDNAQFYLVFIGTGIGFRDTDFNAAEERVTTTGLNLPYGTHMLSIVRSSDGNTMTMKLNGIQIYTDNAGSDRRFHMFTDIVIYQPKKPPVPEDACIIADYMLMADFVKQGDAELTQISKGVRYCNSIQDHLGDGTNAFLMTVHQGNNGDGYNSHWGSGGGRTSYPSGTKSSWTLHFFGTTAMSCVENSAQPNHVITFNGASTTRQNLDCGEHNSGDVITISESVTLGMTNIKAELATGGHHHYATMVATPIHTSSHYQAFETPYLNELVGGDRNMEQNNLVVTADGKTWDEVTRDTSYLGRKCLMIRASANYVPGSWSDNVTHKLNVKRGESDYLSMVEKYWACSYDRYICLEEGEYQVVYRYLRDTSTGNASSAAYINNSVAHIDYTADANHRSGALIFTQHFKRYDTLYVSGAAWGGSACHLLINRMD